MGIDVYCHLPHFRSMHKHISLACRAARRLPKQSHATPQKVVSQEMRMFIANNLMHLANVYQILRKICEYGTHTAAVYWIAVTIFTAPRVPVINFAATTLYELAGPEHADTELAVTQHLTHQELQTLLPQPLELDLPLSTVAVGRAVKTTTAAARVCADPTEQDRVSLQAITARKKNPSSTSNVYNEHNV